MTSGVLRRLYVPLVVALPVLTLGQSGAPPTRADNLDDLPVAEWQPAVESTRSPQEIKEGRGLPHRRIVSGPPIRATDGKRIIFMCGDVRTFPSVADSDAVVTGEIASATARLSADHRVLYSEFRFVVDDIYHSAPFMRPGDALTVLRNGGAVQLPSGRLFSFRVVGERMPVRGGRYLLFLVYEQSSETFYIQTGYRLQHGVAHALDEQAQLKPFNNRPESELLARLREAVSAGQ